MYDVLLSPARAGKDQTNNLSLVAVSNLAFSASVTANSVF